MGADNVVEVEVLLTAEVSMPASYVFRGESHRLLGVAKLVAGALTGQSEGLKCPCLAYVVRHPAAGTILIDTGFHPEADSDRSREFGRVMGIVARSLRPSKQSYEQQLRSRGVDPGGVDRVVMTHLHFDHTSGMRLLPNARFLVSGSEWAAASRRGAAANGFIAHHFPPRSHLELLDFERDGEPHGPFDRSIDLLGDGSIRLLSTPGHTPGHLSVLLETGRGRVLVVGDAAYTLSSIREQRLSLLTADDESYRRSLRQLKSFVEQEPDVIAIPSHDPAAWQQLAVREAG